MAGCGKHATYVEECSKPTPHSDTECTWLLNGVIQSGASSPSSPSWPGASAAQ